MILLIFLTLVVLFFATVVHKNKLERKSKVNPLILVLLIIAVSSCTSKFKNELDLVKTLELRLDSNASRIDLNPADFDARVQEINKNTSVLKNGIKDTITLEFGNQMDKYRTLKKLYSTNAASLRFCKQEQQELENQLRNLRKDLKNNQLSKEEFKTYFIKEKSDVENLIQRSTPIEKSIISIEPEFRRLSKWVYNKIEKLEN